MEYQPNQSSWRRAWEDTKKSRHSFVFFIGVEVVALGAFAYLAVFLTPQNSAAVVSILYVIVGALIGLIIGFSIICFIMLIAAPYKQRNEARQRVTSVEEALNKRLSQLQKQLDDIENAKPNIEFNAEVVSETIKERIVFPTENRITVQTTEDLFMKVPVFIARVCFYNAPQTSVQRVGAPDVAGHVYFYDKDMRLLFDMVGRWAYTREQRQGALPNEVAQITLHPNRMPEPLLIALKDPILTQAYGLNADNEKIPDWRDLNKIIPVGTFRVKVRLEGKNVDKTVWLTLVNKGENEGLVLVPENCVGKS